MILTSVMNGTPEFALCVRNIVLTVEDCRVIGVKHICLFRRVCKDTSVTVLDGWNILPTSFTSFNVFVEISPTITLIL